MKGLRKLILGVVALVGLATVTPAAAQSSRLKAAGVATAVARSGLTVTPDRSWNKAGRPGRLSESWTLDGLTINELTFYGGIIDGKTLFREVDKVNSPLPKFSKTMLAPDIATLLESSYRVALGTSLMEIESIEPSTFAGAPGFKFAYSFAVQDEVKRRGLARGAIIGDKLYLITYEAPRIHYFERDKLSFDKIADSARIAAVKK